MALLLLEDDGLGTSPQLPNSGVLFPVSYSGQPMASQPACDVLLKPTSQALRAHGTGLNSVQPGGLWLGSNGETATGVDNMRM